jgi:amino acid permease
MNKEAFLFGKRNFILLLVGLAFVIVGFVLMIGGGSDDPNVFNEEIFNARRTTWAPLFILVGFAIEVFAIMTKPKNEDAE